MITHMLTRAQCRLLLLVMAIGVAAGLSPVGVASAACGAVAPALGAPSVIGTFPLGYVVGLTPESLAVNASTNSVYVANSH